MAHERIIAQQTIQRYNRNNESSNYCEKRQFRRTKGTLMQKKVSWKFRIVNPKNSRVIRP